MQLIGKLYRKGSGWKADWTFVDNGRVLNSWSREDIDARRAMAAGADGAADALIRRYARSSGGAGPAGTYRIRVVGIDSADDYILLMSHLQELAVVRKVRPVGATADGLLLDLDLISGLSGFRRMIQPRGILVGAEATAEGEVPTFRMH